MSGNASPAWRRNRETQPIGCWQIGAWGAGGPGQPPVCTPGLQTDPTVSRWPGDHPPPYPSHLSTLCPELTNVPPVVGVPSTLVVGKAQLHLNTVGRMQSRAWSQWEGQPCPTSHSCARQRGLRTLVGGKSGAKLGHLQSCGDFTVSRGRQWGNGGPGNRICLSY